ncbi:hypothetical protein [Xanthomonas euvesicatoria]|uniref:hypothetical protein n=1 Tax=Xanthomonas euvesicatoria TaxID=456327 RepID=UPI001C43CC3D|nr:hypothetical protein [Xanthomonas euvesicatoria]MBV6807974.1 hypothetical protein [Xanthomonas campestris pv. convolvuli]
MPALLRNDAIRLFEAAQEALHIAISSLGTSKRKEFRQSGAHYAIETGLIGTAAEQVMAACIVQAHGPSAIAWPSGQYKTAGAVLEEFIELLTQATAVTGFLTDGVPDPVAHRTSLIQSIRSFRLLIATRAGGLHAGRGLLHEAVVEQANQVSEVLMLLARSRRIEPYVANVPRCTWYSRDRMVMIEDLVARLRAAHNDPGALASVYMVLPDLPANAPEWLEAFDRVVVAPKQRDIRFLLDVADQALPAALRRANAAQGAIAVRVAPNDPGALPIAPQFLRRAFNEIAELWDADVATANGRLEHGALDLPPQDSVLDALAVGLGQSGILRDGEKLSAHQSWPAVMSSLVLKGTPGPYWFLVRSCNDLGQLAALLQRAGDIRALPAMAKRAYDECLRGIDLIRNNHAVPVNDDLLGDLLSSATRRIETAGLRVQFKAALGTVRELPAELSPMLEQVADGGEPASTLISSLVNMDVDVTCRRYWLRILAEKANDPDDIPSLVAILRQPEIAGVSTTARQAIRRIDFAMSGPSLVTV